MGFNSGFKGLNSFWLQAATGGYMANKPTFRERQRW